MPKELYEEAIADVRRLKEVAENNAKKAVIEAVTPRIREFIEAQLMGVEQPVDDEDDMLLDADPVAPVTEPGDSESIDSVSMPDEQGKVTLDLDGLTSGDPEDEIELSLESSNSLSTSKRDVIAEVEARVKDLTRATNKLVDATRSIGLTRGLKEDVEKVVSEVRDTYGQVQDNVRPSARRSVVEERLERLYRTLNELSERRDMKNKKRIAEADVNLKLSGLPDEVELDDLGVQLSSDEGGDEDLDLDGDEGGEDASGDEDLDLDVDLDDESGSDAEAEGEDDEVVEIDESALRRELSRIKKVREGVEGTKPASWGHGPGDVSDDFEDEDLGDPLEDVKLNEADDEDDESCLEDAPAGDDESETQMESQIRREKRFVEAAKRRLVNLKARYVEAARKMKHFTEAKKRARKSAEVKEAEAAMRKANKMQKELQESFGRTQELLRESVSRVNKMQRLVEAKKSGLVNEARNGKADDSQKLRQKLTETNLFNTKLIYTNKLLQNESLTSKQKSEVVKRLDEAKSQREVRLVYEALVNSFKATSAPLRESTDRGVAGSSSRTTRPAGSNAPVNEGIDTDRWGLLAGITK